MHSWSTLDQIYSKSNLSNNLSTLVQKEYLNTVNYHLINEVKDAETQKYFYRNKLNLQNRQHQTQLEQLFQLLSEKNEFLLNLEQQLDRCKKDYRILSDEYILIKNNYQDYKQNSKQQIEIINKYYQAKIIEIQEIAEKKCYQKIQKRVLEVEKEYQDRIKLYKNQIEQLTQNSRQITHELKLLQQNHRLLLMKNDQLNQQNIHRQLRKRDFDIQNNHLKDLAQYQAIKNQRNTLKEILEQSGNSINTLKKDNERYKSQLQMYQTRIKDLQEVIKNQKYKLNELKQQINKDTKQNETNTNEEYIPIALPLDLNLIGEIISLKQFLIQNLIIKFYNFFCKCIIKENKKKLYSLQIFKCNLHQLKQRTNQQNNLLFYIWYHLEKIIKLYYPSIQINLEKQNLYCTIKDQFIRKNLIQCSNITNSVQKLYRILQLLYRLRNPINHLKCQISNKEMKIVQSQLLKCLKKIFKQNNY